MNHVSLSATPLPAETVHTSHTAQRDKPAPGSFFARLQRVFASAEEDEIQTGFELNADREEFFEYHNPTLGLTGFSDAA